MALGVGTTAMTARFKGARDPDSANKTFNQSLIMSLVLSVVLCVIMLFLRMPLMRFIAGSELSSAAVNGGGRYFLVQIIGFPFVALSFTMSAALRGIGNTRASFYANSVSNIVNVALNYCLIGGNLGFPRLEVLGASIATAIGQCCAFIMLVVIVIRSRGFIGFSWKLLRRPDLKMIRRISRIGVPALGEQAAMRIGMLVFTMIVTRLGDNPYSAHMIAINIQSLSFAPGQAFGTAATTLMGQGLGRKRPDLSRWYVNETQKIGLVVSIAVALLLFFGGRQIGEMYVHSTVDPADAEAFAAEAANNEIVLTLAANMLKIVALANIFSNARFIGLAALRGAGDARYAAVVTFITIIGFRTILSFILTRLGLGLYGVWISLASDGIVAFFMSQARYKKGKWAAIEV